MLEGREPRFTMYFSLSRGDLHFLSICEPGKLHDVLQSELRLGYDTMLVRVEGVEQGLLENERPVLFACFHDILDVLNVTYHFIVADKILEGHQLAGFWTKDAVLIWKSIRSMLGAFPAVNELWTQTKEGKIRNSESCNLGRLCYEDFYFVVSCQTTAC